MSFDWLDKFCRQLTKSPDYAEKTLAAYQLGMKAKGSITGVVIQVEADCCDAARRLPAERIYLPKDAPRIPLTDCSRGNRCSCVYRPLMSYQKQN